MVALLLSSFFFNHIQVAAMSRWCSSWKGRVWLLLESCKIDTNTDKLGSQMSEVWLSDDPVQSRCYSWSIRTKIRCSTLPWILTKWKLRMIGEGRKLNKKLERKTKTYCIVTFREKVEMCICSLQFLEQAFHPNFLLCRTHWLRLFDCICNEYDNWWSGSIHLKNSKCKNKWMKAWSSNFVIAFERSY